MKMAHECKETFNNKAQSSPDRDARVPWRGEGGDAAGAAVVLRSVFALLPARALWRCGGVSLAWRRAADDDALWRRLVVPNATPQTLRVFAATAKTDTLHDNEDVTQCRWRKEYYRSKVQWRRQSRLVAPGPQAAPLQCAALHPAGPCLAILDEDVQLIVWENTNENSVSNDVREQAGWRVRWRGCAGAGWRSASHAQWAPRARRLLVAGRLALSDRSELLVLEFNVGWHKTTLCRCACGPGGACWLTDDLFLTLQLRLAGPALAFTTVWLNAASQETQSEHTGVTTPLFRIFNEAATHVSHFLTVEIPNPDRASSENELNKRVDQIKCEPTASYYRALKPKRDNTENTTRLLIVACGAAGSKRGEAQALAAWPVPAAPALPPVRVLDALAERVRLRRERASRPAAADNAPEEQAVRALCTPPTAICNLFAQILGFVLHPRGGCVWVSTAAGAACVALAGLRPLLLVPRQSPPRASPLPAHYLWPTVDDDYFATPAGCGSACVDVLAVRSARPGARLLHGAPALAALLLPRAPSCPRAPRTLLVLTSEALHVWQAFID